MNFIKRPQSYVEPKTYHEVFQGSQAGEEVFQELCSIFYDTQSFIAGDSHRTAFNEGKRSVIGFIISKINEATNGPEGDNNG